MARQVARFIALLLVVAVMVVLYQVAPSKAAIEQAFCQQKIEEAVADVTAASMCMRSNGCSLSYEHHQALVRLLADAERCGAAVTIKQAGPPQAEPQHNPF